MPVRQRQIICQRCLAPNALGLDLCARCGTRLMLVVEPSTLRFEEELMVSGDYDEHLLERISILENHLQRIVERLEQTLDLMFRQNRTAYFDHTLLQTLIGLLAESGAVNEKRLETLWRSRCERDEAKTDERDRQEDFCTRVLASYHGTQRELLMRLVKEGLELLTGEQKARGIRRLERAAALAPDNAALNAFLGEHFFRAGKTAPAREYLARAHMTDPENGHLQLLLGLVCGDAGETARAKELLSGAVRRTGSSFAAHYALGRLLMAESDWKSALAEFKRALAARPCPEAHYVVGLVYYQLERPRMALRHLLSAVEMDPGYAEAFYLAGLVHLRLGERRRAAEAFDAAHSVDEAEPRYRAARESVARAGGAPPPPLFIAKGQKTRRLVTGGDDRLAAALQEDALNHVAPR